MDVKSQRVFSDPVLFVRFTELLSKQQEVDRINDNTFDQLVNDFFPKVISFVEQEFQSLNVRHIICTAEINNSMYCYKSGTLKDVAESVRGYVTKVITDYMIERIPLRLISEQRVEDLQKYIRKNICHPEESDSFVSRIHREILCSYEERNNVRLEEYKKKCDITKFDFDEFIKTVETE